ncbi:MAG: NADH-quinone oxidoreductase subunit M [Isosphaeraceae bacterium]
MPTLLVITVLLPLFGSAALLLAPKLDHKSARVIALGTALVTLALTVLLVVNFDKTLTTPQFAFQPKNGLYGLSWVAVPGGSGIRFAFGLDGLSLWVFALTALLVITAIFSSWESIKEQAAAHYALILALEAGLLGLFASLDIILFYIFFEFSLLPLFFLIGIYGGPERRRAAITFFLYTLVGSLLTLLGMIALVVIHRQYGPGHVLTFSIPELTEGLKSLTWDEWRAAPTSWTSPQVLIFLLLFAGFAVKVPLVPFHTWLPLAHVEAPTAGSILLAGVLLKVGSYGFLRFNMSMVPQGAIYLFPLLATIAVAGIIYGALTALAQTDVKKLVAYSSVSHLGFIALGTFAMTGTGMDGAVIQMLNHGLNTGALFACVGIIYERYHTREMAELSGLWKRLPIFAFFFILTGLASAGVPGLNGFTGEFPILLGMFARSRLFGVLGATGMIFGAYYIFWMLQKFAFGPLHEPWGHSEHADGHGNEHPQIRPVGWHEIAGLSPIMVLIVVIGVYPKPFFDRLRPTVATIAANYPQPEFERPRPAVVSTDGTTRVSLAQDRAR